MATIVAHSTSRTVSSIFSLGICMRTNQNFDIIVFEREKHIMVPRFSFPFLLFLLPFSCFSSILEEKFQAVLLCVSLAQFIVLYSFRHNLLHFRTLSVEYQRHLLACKVMTLLVVQVRGLLLTGFSRFRS